MANGSVIVGGTRAIGLELPATTSRLGRRHHRRDREHRECRQGLGGGRSLGSRFDLAEPETIAPALADVGPVRRLALVAIERDQNSVADYDLAQAIRLVTLKLVGYTEVVHQLHGRLTDDASILLFGGMAKRAYTGSTTVTTVNGGVVGLTRTLVEELKPRRVNSIHPGIVGTARTGRRRRQPASATSETPLGRLREHVGDGNAAVFLLENTAVNGVDLIVDGGWYCR